MLFGEVSAARKVEVLIRFLIGDTAISL